MKNGPYELVVAPAGYPGRRYRGRYAYEHHVVWWRHTGTLVPRGFLLHHRNENKRDNRVRNLKLQSRGAHTVHHSAKPLLSVHCGWCQSEFKIKGNVYRTRRKLSVTGKVFCSRRCGAKYQHQSSR